VNKPPPHIIHLPPPITSGEISDKRMDYLVERPFSVHFSVHRPSSGWAKETEARNAVFIS